MSTFSRETIHDVKTVTLKSKLVNALEKNWDTLEIEIVDQNGITKTILLFGVEDKEINIENEK
tara:strand:- start:24 stop:212 length:189 start_codon:yes stop_codon:yes gene_type:complete